MKVRFIKEVHNKIQIDKNNNKMLKRYKKNDKIQTNKVLYHYEM
jgi:hypothetical protein